MRVPQEPEELTRGWVEEALGEASGALSAVNVEPITGAGIIGRICRLQLNWASSEPGAPGSVVAKLTNGIPAALADPVYRALFTREIRFYREFSADVGVATPQLFHADADEDSGAAVLLMEDLADRGTIFGTGEAPAAAIEAIARAVAPLHARWWNDPRLPEMDWLYSSDGFAERWSGQMRTGLPEHRGWYEEHANDLVPLLEPALEAVDRGLFDSRGAVTMIHGDLGLKNAAVADGEIVLFDWQLLSRDTPARELIDLVKDAFGEVGPVELAERVVSAYADALSDAGVTDVSRDTLIEGLGIQGMRGVVSPLMLLTLPGDDPMREQVALRWVALASDFLGPFKLHERLDTFLSQH